MGFGGVDGCIASGHFSVGENIFREIMEQLNIIAVRLRLIYQAVAMMMAGGYWLCRDELD